AAEDLFLEAQYERDLGAVQAIADAIYYLGRDHAALSDDDIQYVMNGAEARAESFGDRGRSGPNGPPPPNSEADYGFAKTDGTVVSSTEGGAAPDVYDAGDDTEPPPPRGWLLGNQFCRGFLSSLVAPGAAGKTALRVLQLLALAVARNLTG